MCSETGSPNRRLECTTVCWPNLRAFPLGWIRVKLASLDFDAQGVDRTFVPSPWFGFFSRANGLKEPTPDTHPIRKKTVFSANPFVKTKGGGITPGRVRSDPASPSQTLPLQTKFSKAPSAQNNFNRAKARFPSSPLDCVVKALFLIHDCAVARCFEYLIFDF